MAGRHRNRTDKELEELLQQSDSDSVPMLDSDDGDTDSDPESELDKTPDNDSGRYLVDFIIERFFILI